MQNSKQNYFTKYFESDIKTIKNKWKRIKNISLKNSASNSSNLFKFNNDTISDPVKIANVFNNYFS